MKPLVNVARAMGRLEITVDPDAGPASRMFASFLKFGVQQDLVSTREIAERISAIRQGRISDWRTVQNEFVLHIFFDHATIKLQYPDDNLPSNITLSLDELEDGVERWLHGLSDRG